ncbi:hypothetical protein TK50_00490 [Micromonospora haikouensis]|uniref:Uncharacterized protein n=1 Tax=Micromonospora haikouensis TaxID=686309 RepID=A0A0D0X051_9ACTN|nr:hypothetical protein TK50_00490 [Micromonospora haikouensis]
MKFQTWMPMSMRRPSPTAGPDQRMHVLSLSWWTVEVMDRVAAGVFGVSGTGVVHRNCEPARSAPRSSRLATCPPFPDGDGGTRSRSTVTAPTQS